ncbi:conserved domain protein [Turicibacter sp. HGF1]|uniref:hypothetical protein n=1 Tax=Turicibacter sp. HGF1 TaxID=910310 RepID=UPI0001FD88E6|nr:hypothetical protein [Turicibacter sp. HGF1]EGC90820.1 conserved domain protein [Turicibacter sp. HGF1]
MKLKLKKISQNKMFVWLLFFCPFIIPFLNQFLKIPSFIKYAFDIIWFFLLLTMVTKKKRIVDSKTKIIINFVLLFFLFTVLNYVLKFQSPLYYLWGFRNNFRGFVFFFGVVYYFDENDINKAFKYLNIIFHINTIFMLFQFLLLGYKQDHLGGIFGVTQGCNAYVNLFFCIMLSIYFVSYLEKKQGIINTVFNIVIMLVLAAMAELKFFYIEFLIILLFGILVTKFSLKKICVIICSFIALSIGYKVFLQVFPDIDLTISGLFEYASSNKGYTSSGDLNRLSFIGTINDSFLYTPFLQLTGLGLGNCDYASGIDFLMTPFYLHFEWIHYAWMSTTFMYLENGLVGLCFLFGFFIIIGVQNLMSTNNRHLKFYKQICLLCCLVGILNIFYNISMRLESGYMLYFILAIPYCLSKNITERR